MYRKRHQRPAGLQTPHQRADGGELARDAVRDGRRDARDLLQHARVRVGRGVARAHLPRLHAEGGRLVDGVPLPPVRDRADVLREDGDPLRRLDGRGGVVDLGAVHDLQLEEGVFDRVLVDVLRGWLGVFSLASCGLGLGLGLAAWWWCWWWDGGSTSRSVDRVGAGIAHCGLELAVAYAAVLAHPGRETLDEIDDGVVFVVSLHLEDVSLEVGALSPEGELDELGRRHEDHGVPLRLDAFLLDGLPVPCVLVEPRPDSPPPLDHVLDGAGVGVVLDG
ncbi:hypothetical protein VP1G_11380 [Cytospora mali]|uniref:Uncharacterized protein n=1 Tax=Cytospora mali TaxID=578113 RepID=A0A194VE97_CYTMA|nr:hypothetical protein VP1G_11380 [Valsa mali var. pyri (nom. inval.)]